MTAPPERTPPGRWYLALGAMLRWQFGGPASAPPIDFRGIALGMGFGERDLLAVPRRCRPA